LKLKLGIEETKKIAKPGKEDKPLKEASRWLLAAALVGFISLAVFLWYSQNSNQDSKVAIHNNKNSVTSSDSVNAGSSKNNAQPQQIPPQGHTPSKGFPDREEVAQNEKAEAKQDIREKYTIDSTRRESLFATNFVKDTTPADADGRLRKAFTFYNNSDYVNALLAFDKSETLVRRGMDEHKALTKFYTDYYRALSYLSIDSTETAISFLRDSITASPDSLWKGKVDWYLALAYLKTGSITEAKRLLQRISTNQAASEYKAKSLALVNELDKK
jgi:tetratricopeptide (TPR) repeat protein